MDADRPAPEVREALEDLEQYLSDVIPPLVMADSFKLLLRQPPELTAARIHSWADSRLHSSPEVTRSDDLSFAARRVQLMSEFHLVPMEPFERFLQELMQRLLDYCPEAERAGFLQNLSRLGVPTGTASSPTDPLPRARSTESAPAGVAMPAGPRLTTEETRAFRRHALLLDRLGKDVSDGKRPAEDPVTAALFSHALAAAARDSRDDREFDQSLGRLREIGLDVEIEQLFRTLGGSLPGWIPPAPAAEGEVSPAPKESILEETMHRIVTQPQDPAEAGHRFFEMVKAAVERFNEGALPQAATMLALAERIVAEERIDPGTVEVARGKADESLDFERLRRFAEVPAQHPLLRHVLGFFRSLSPKGLLTELLRELKRERRKLLLLLIEAHGTPGRKAVLDRLQPPFGQGVGDERWYFRRNLLYLMRRIPPPAGASLAEDVDVAVRHSVLKFPLPLVKEAVANLSLLKHERAEHTLIGLLKDMEAMLARPADAPYDPREIQVVLDRIVSALARFGTAASRRAVVEHCLKGKQELGDTMSRLSELAGQDLSGDTGLVERLLAVLKADSPRKVFVVLVHPKDQNLKHVIEALSATPTPSVRKALEGLVKDFPGLEAGRAASRALSSLVAARPIPEAPYDTRSGELEPFALPALVQSLSESRLSGEMILKSGKGEVIGKLALQEGKIAGCETGSLRGQEAFFHLLERPVAASFLFTRQSGAPAAPPGSLLDVAPLCQEGMRRYDELQLTAALVPDTTVLKPTQVRPTPHVEEQDGIFVNKLWLSAREGVTPRECEAAIAADSFRIRRQLAHWVESGALQML